MKPKEFITVVSGLPRSGTSLMMAMLDRGGIPPVQDGVREADDDNPKGYYEFERVKRIAEDKAWLPACKGKAVKMISRLLVELPPGYTYKVIWMRRNIDEILASQKKMLVRRGTYDASVKDDDVRRMLLKHVEKTLQWVKDHPYVDMIFTHYNKLLDDPKDEIARLNDHLGGDLDVAAMQASIDPSLYRNRA
ncbi:MAG: sulfotransferase family protein [Phycisphaerales bacterium]|nr:MAG: sulfotransferase family protein [Phycisphaerales bacterium]